MAHGDTSPIEKIAEEEWENVKNRFNFPDDVTLEFAAPLPGRAAFGSWNSFTRTVTLFPKSIVTQPREKGESALRRSVLTVLHEAAHAVATEEPGGVVRKKPGTPHGSLFQKNLARTTRGRTSVLEEGKERARAIDRGAREGSSFLQLSPAGFCAGEPQTA